MGDIDAKSVETILAALKEGVSATQTGVYIEVTGSELKVLYERRAKEARARAARIEALAAKTTDDDEMLFASAQTVAHRRQMAKGYIDTYSKGAECAEFIAQHIDVTRNFRLHTGEMINFFIPMAGGGMLPPCNF